MFEIVETYTGEKIQYDDVDHKYLTLDGKPMMSGSKYAEKYIDKFEVEKEAEKFAMKHGVSVDTIKQIWQNNSEVSTGFGTAMHLALETYAKYQEEVSHITNKGYHYALPSNPVMRNIAQMYIETIGVPYVCVCEPFVSHVAELMVGQVDRIDILDTMYCDVTDYKNVADIHKKKPMNFPYNYVQTTLEYYFMQTSFYTHMLEKFGWTVRNVNIDNWDGQKWTRFISKPYTLMI